MPEPLACPICGKPVAIAPERRPASFPFCTARCRDRDFGRWIDGAYAVAGEAGPEDQDEAESPARQGADGDETR
jgi:endogenous inhibitor of DNA gyrase (YacG/DUF329 family)